MKLTSSTRLITSALGLLAALPASAQLYFDTNGATAGTTQTTGTFTWDTGTNWSTDTAGAIATTAWVNGSNVIFSAGTEGAVAYTVTVAGTVQTNSITFNQNVSSTYTISGGTINAGASLLTLNASAAGVTTGRTRSITSSLIGSGGVTIAANGDTSDTGGGSTTIFGLDGANTFTGNVTITAGIVRASSSFGSAANTLTLNGGGLVANTSTTVANNIIAGSSGATLRAYGSQILNLTGTLTGAGNVSKTDSGIAYLSGDGSAFANTIRVRNGDLYLVSANWAQANLDLTTTTGRLFIAPISPGSTVTINNVTTQRDVFIQNNALLDVDTGVVNMVNAGHYIQRSTGTGSLTSSSGTLTVAAGGSTGNLTTLDHQIRVNVVNFNGSTPLTLVKNNVNNLILDQPNTYTGGTTINGGRLQASHAAALGSGTVTVNSGAQLYLPLAATYANNITLNGNGVTEAAGTLGALRLEAGARVTGNVTIASPSRLMAYSGVSATISGNLLGSAALEINDTASAAGNGTVSLNGAGTYSGALTVSRGRLNLNGSNHAQIIVADGAAIGGEGTAENLTMGVTTGATLYADATTPGSLTVNDFISTGTVTVALTGASATPGPVTVLTTVNDISGTPVFALANPANYRSSVVTVGAKSVTVDTGSLSTVWTGSVNGNWNFNTDSNFSNGGAQTFYAGDTVTFNDTSAVAAVSLVGTITPGGLTFNNNTTAYNIGGAGLLAGTFAVTKSGTATATLGGTGNTYTGGINVTGGVLKMGSATAFGVTNSVTVASGAQVDLNGQTPGTIATGGHSYTIAGNGPDGLGAITNTGANNASNAGIKNLTLSGNASVGSSVAGARFDMGFANVAGTGSVNGNGFTLTKVGVNQVELRGPTTNMPIVVSSGILVAENNDYALGGPTGSVTVNGGTLATFGALSIGTPATFATGTSLSSLSGTATWYGALTFNGATNLDTTSGSLTLYGPLSGSGALTRNNAANTLTITGNNPAFTGSLTNVGGTIALGGGGATGSLGSSSGINLNVGTLTLSYNANVSNVLPPVILGASTTLNSSNTTQVAKTTINQNISAGALITPQLRVTGGILELGAGANVDVGGTVGLLGPASNIATLSVLPGASLATNYLAIGNEANGNIGIFNQSGGTVTVKAGGTGFRLGHWNTNTAVVPNQFNISGGTFDATALSANVTTARIVNIGWDGYGVATVGGGATTATLKTFGIQLDANGDSTTYNDTLTVSNNGIVEVGAGGFANSGTTATALNDRLILNGGTVKTTVTGAWTTPATVNAATASSVEVPTGLTLTLSGAFIGTGTLNKTGEGNLVLSNIAGFTGTLGVNGGNLAPGGVGTTGTLALNSALNVGTGGAVAFELNGASTTTGNDKVTVAGNLTFGSNSYLRPTFAGAPVSGNVYNLFTYTGSLSGAPVVDPTYTSGTRVAYVVDTATPGQVNLSVSGAVATLVWAGTPSHNWDVNDSVAWTNTGFSDRFFNSDSVSFDDSGDNTAPVTLVGTVFPAGFSVNATKDYVFSGAGTLAGATGLTKSGSGKVTFLNTAAHTSTGPVSISGGTVQVGTGGTAGTLPGTGAVTFSTGTLNYNHSANETISRQLIGTGGTFVKDGANTMTTNMSGNTADIVVNGGTLVARGGAFSTAFAADKLITINAGATLDTAVHSMGSTVGGGGNVPLVTLNGGTWILNGEQYMKTLTMTAGTTVKVGALDGIRTLAGSVYTINAAATSSVIGSPLNLVNNVSIVVNDGTAADDLVVSGLVSNVGIVTKTGAGTMTLTGTANTATGAFNVNAGTVSVPTLNESTAAGPLAQGAVTLNGGTLLYTGATASSGRVLGLGVSGGTVSVSDPAANLTLTGVLAANSLTKTGAGTLTLNAVNTHASTTVLAGKLVVGSTTALGAGGVTLTGGSLDLNSLVLPAANTISVGAAGTVTGAGIFTSTGTIDGTLTPGGTGATGRITTANPLTLGATAVTNLEIGGTAPGSFDSVEAQSDVTLAGTVNVSFINSFTPVAGNSFDLFVEDGAFTSTALLNLPALPSGLAWNTSLFATSGVVSVVTSDPLVTFTGNYGLTGPDALAGADPDHDGINNALEYAFGLVPNAPNSQAEYRGVGSATAGQQLTLAYRRPVGGVAGVTYGVQTKTADLDLGDTGWNNAILNTDYTRNIVNNGDGTETVTITFTGAVTSGKKFGRISVTF